MATKKLHFETLQLHVGQEQPDPATDARAVPIYQTTSYVFHNSAHAAARFGLQDPGNIYGRLTNSTQAVFEQRVAALEGGVAGLAVASGAAAITYAFQNITRAGDHVVAAKTIYGGTYNLLAHTLPTYGVTATFVDPGDLSNFEKAIQENTKAVFIETLGNPNSNIIDIEATKQELINQNIRNKEQEQEIENLNIRSNAQKAETDNLKEQIFNLTEENKRLREQYVKIPKWRFLWRKK